MSNIKARRKLSDLFKRGVEVRFGPDGGRIGPFKDEDGKRTKPAEEEVAMWVQAPSPLQRDMALRDAQAARAKAMLRARRETDSEEHLTTKAFVADMEWGTLVDYVLMIDQEERRNDAIRDVLARDEWKDFPALQDAMRRLDEDEPDPDDPDAEALMEADRRYGDQVIQRDKELTEAAREVLEMQSREALEARAIAKRSEIAASQAFMREYESQMLFYAVRDIDDTGVLFFESARELADADEEVQTVLVDALASFINEAGEAKNLSGAADSSISSTPPSEPETSQDSTQQDATD